jgi:transposase InsO family protein
MDQDQFGGSSPSRRYSTIKNHTGETITLLRPDNGTEYVNAATSKWTMGMGIHHKMSATYTPEQNGTLERVNCTIMESA